MPRLFAFSCLLVMSLTSFSTLSAETIMVDGSSTVFPITVAMGQSFEQRNPDEKVDVKFSGSSSGFRKLLAGEIDLSGASRPIKSGELEQAAARGIDIIELPVAYDGITVVVKKSNDFLQDISVSELKRIWEPGSEVRTWRQIRPSWPDKAISLYGPGKDSGTFEYYTKAIMGKAHASRTDVHESEDDQELVQGVVANPYAMGYFGWAYYLENKSLLRPVAITAKDSQTPIMPSHESILDGSYAPLSRPIFIYVNKARLAKPEVREFVKLYLELAPELVGQVGYVPLGEHNYRLTRRRFDERKTGSVFSGLKGRIDVAAVLEAGFASTTPVATTTPQPAAKADKSAQLTQAVDDLRDACLGLSQKALSDRTTVGEMDRQLRIIQAQVQHLLDHHGAQQTLGN